MIFDFRDGFYNGFFENPFTGGDNKINHQFLNGEMLYSATKNGSSPGILREIEVIPHEQYIFQVEGRALNGAKVSLFASEAWNVASQLIKFGEVSLPKDKTSLVEIVFTAPLSGKVFIGLLFNNPQKNHMFALQRVEVSVINLIERERMTKLNTAIEAQNKIIDQLRQVIANQTQMILQLNKTVSTLTKDEALIEEKMNNTIDRDSFVRLMAVFQRDTLQTTIELFQTQLTNKVLPGDSNNRYGLFSSSETKFLEEIDDPYRKLLPITSNQ